MRNISIENFGPIDGRFAISLDQKLTILIGEQATGKSTIARWLYYCTLYTPADNDEKNRDALQHMLNYADQMILQRSYSNNADEASTTLSFINGNRNTIIKESNLKNPHSLYIPAGRSIIPLLFESYAAAAKIKVDPFFEEFLLFLDGIRKEYNASLHDMLAKALRHPENAVDAMNAKAAIVLINQILKGEYRYKRGTELFYYNDEQFAAITTASSGQQEILYILMALFYVLLNPKPYTIIIEEPEAHIFPMAQKLIMELVARVINATDSRIIITTHSPYILTSTNLLMHSAKVENKINDTKTVVDPMARLTPEEVSAYLLECNGKFSYRSIIDDETGLIAAEEIDTVSELIDQSMSALIDLEVKHGL